MNKLWTRVGNHQFLPNKTGSDVCDGWEIVDTEELGEKLKSGDVLTEAILTDVSEINVFVIFALIFINHLINNFLGNTTAAGEEF